MRIVIFLLVFTFSLNVFGQADSVAVKKKEEVKKKGWNFLPFPYITFDTDLGIEFGASLTAVDYGKKGDIYPNFYHMFSVSASIYTHGSATLMVNYQSDYLIKGVETYLDMAYLPDMAFDFYGFNGYESVFNANWIEDNSPDYRSRLFYKMKRKMLRIRSTFIGRIRKSNFKWLTGLEFYNLNINSLDVDRFNKSKEDDLLPTVDSIPPLFDRYKQWGLINKNEENGGFFSVLKLGMVYDTRNNKQDPTSGIWAEITMEGVPKFMSTMEKGFLKLTAYWRQYIPIVKNHLTFAYRLNYQGTIAGYAPFYAQTFKFNSVANGLYNEGLGGGKTIRGVLRNRVVGDGIVMGNFEFRYSFWKFIVFKQNIDLVASGFFDTGKVVKRIDVDDIIENLTEEEIDYKHVGDTKKDYFNIGAEKFHNSAGGGLHIILNHNIIVAFDFAKAFNEQDNNGLGVYIGSYFLF